MAVKLIKTTIISSSTGELMEASFPMDYGLYQSAFSLSEEKRTKFLTDCYYEFKREERKQRRAISLEQMLEDSTGFEDGLIDDSLNPEEQCLRNEKYELLYEAISKLNGRQRRIIVELFYHDKSQRELAAENGMSEQAMSMYVAYVLAKLRNLLDGKI